MKIEKNPKREILGRGLGLRITTPIFFLISVMLSIVERRKRKRERKEKKMEKYMAVMVI